MDTVNKQTSQRLSALFRLFLDFANKQTSLGFGLVALLTAGGEQIFSWVVFKCPCNDMNFVYGMVFLLVPALALLLLSYILSKKMWKLLTGLCHRKRMATTVPAESTAPQAEPSRCRKMTTAVVVLLQISCGAVVAPSTWIAVALLNGNYYECAMSGTNVSAYNRHVCGDGEVGEKCEKELYRLPCDKGSEVPKATRDDVLLTLRAHSQILGWLLITCIMLSSLMLTCVARCKSPISYLQLMFWKAYAQEENNLIDSYTTKHAKELAERNLKSFFNKKRLENGITPSNEDWEGISSLFKFSTKDQYYSTLHKYVQNMHIEMRDASVKSRESVENPTVVKSECEASV